MHGMTERFLTILKRTFCVVWCYRTMLFSFLVIFTPVLVVCHDLINFCRGRFKGLVSVSLNQERQLSGPLCELAGHDVHVNGKYILPYSEVISYCAWSSAGLAVSACIFLKKLKRQRSCYGIFKS